MFIFTPVNLPTPAIVASSAARRLPRSALLMLCAMYVLMGFIGREPWKSADMAALGYMTELASGSTSWLKPTLLGLPDEYNSLLPHWLGAVAILMAPAGVSPVSAARIPFMLLLLLALGATWYSVYLLARHPQAQPVPFAFGGEALPTDYARALADGGLLALLACLGLAQLSHETTPALAQLGFASLLFFGLSALATHPDRALLALTLALPGLSLSGAPSLCVILALPALLWWWARGFALLTPHRHRWMLLALALIAWTGMLSGLLDLMEWRLQWPQTDGGDWKRFVRLLIWFTWPVWPLALWTLWQWRRQLAHWHIALPLWWALVVGVSALCSATSDRTLLLALPALATLAAFALPTLQRSVAALVDWFTLLFFTGCGIVIWVIWLAMQTGFPARPAANVARLAPGFESNGSSLAFILALAASVAWAALVRWRVGRHRSVLWKSLVLPASGATLCWILLMTLWLPLLDFARSYAPLTRKVAAIIPAPASCVAVHGLSPAQISAFRFHTPLDLRRLPADCPWLLVDNDAVGSLSRTEAASLWEPVAKVRRPSDNNEDVVIFRRIQAAPALNQDAFTDSTTGSVTIERSPLPSSPIDHSSRSK